MEASKRRRMECHIPPTLDYVTFEQEAADVYLAREQDNIVFFVRGAANSYVSNPDQLAAHLHDHFFPCSSRPGHASYQIDGTRELVKLSFMGLQSYVDLGDLVDAVGTGSRIIEVEDPRDGIVDSFPSFSSRAASLGERDSFVSGLHCQEGQSGDVLRIRPIDASCQSVAFDDGRCRWHAIKSGSCDKPLTAWQAQARHAAITAPRPVQVDSDGEAESDESDDSDANDGYIETLGDVIDRNHIRFSDLFNEPIVGFTWPASVRSIQFGSDFNQPIVGATWPAGLEEIEFGSDFNQPIVGVTWPEGLWNIEFGEASFNQPIVGVTWPAGLWHIALGNTFNHPIDDVTWPAGLLDIEFGDAFNQRIDNVIWPHGLQKVSFGAAFDKNIDEAHWPTSMQEIKIDGVVVPVLI